MRTFILATLLLFPVGAFGANSPECAFETIRTGGVDDAFLLPADPVHRSPGLAAYLATRNPKSYDDTTIDRHFGDSFKLDECLICESMCAATLEIELQGSGGLDCNDSLFVGEAGGLAVYSQSIKPGGCEFQQVPSDTYAFWRVGLLEESTVRTIDLDVGALQELVCNRGYRWLDVIVQDDHAVDSMRLVIRH